MGGDKGKIAVIKRPQVRSLSDHTHHQRNILRKPYPISVRKIPAGFKFLIRQHFHKKATGFTKATVKV